MKVEKRIHLIWKDLQRIKKTPSMKDIGLKCHKYQYIYSKRGKKISLVRITSGFGGKMLWEIYCLKGNLFDDVIKFNTKKGAEDAIKGLFQTNIKKS